MKNIHIIRASSLLPFVQFLDNIGTPVDRLLDSVKLNRELILSPDAYCSQHQRWQFIDKAAHLEGIENLGFLVGLNNPFASHGIIAKIILNQPTLRDALNTVKKICNFHHTHLKEKLLLTLNHSKVWFGLKKFYNIEVPGQIQAEEMSIIAFIKLIKAYLGKEWIPEEIHIPKSNYRDNSWLFISENKSSQLCFSDDFYAIVFSSDILDKPKINNEFALSESEIQSFLCPKSPQSMAEKIEIMMRFFLSSDVKTIENIADLVGIKKRTLQRYLHNQGTTYEQILQKTRDKLAQQKLIQNNMSITDIAFSLGYDSPQNFSRAFKTWHGISPRQFKIKYSLSKTI